MSGKSRRSSCPSRLIEEGRSRVVTIRGVRGAVDVAMSGAYALRRLAQRRTAKSCGPGLPALRPSAGAFLALVATRGQESRSPGRARISRQTIAQGRPDIWLNLWFCRVLFCCTRTAGISRYPAFPAPSVRGGWSRCKARATHVARMRSYAPLCSAVIARSVSDEAIQSPCVILDCFASLATTVQGSASKSKPIEHKPLDPPRRA